MSKDTPITEEEHALIPRALSHEIYLLYTLTTALDALIYDIERRFRAVKSNFHFEREAKLHLNRYFEHLEKCKTYYDNFVCPSIIKVTTASDRRGYDDTRIRAQEILRLIMLYYTQCSDRDNHEKVFEFISSLEGGDDIFTVEDINRFDLGCK